jgi:hypothetical protein
LGKSEDEGRRNAGRGCEGGRGGEGSTGAVVAEREGAADGSAEDVGADGFRMGDGGCIVSMRQRETVN